MKDIFSKQKTVNISVYLQYPISTILIQLMLVAALLVVTHYKCPQLPVMRAHLATPPRADRLQIIVGNQGQLVAPPSSYLAPGGSGPTLCTLKCTDNNNVGAKTSGLGPVLLSQPPLSQVLNLNVQF